MNKRAVTKAEKTFNEANDALRDFETGTTKVECPHCGKNLYVDNEDVLNDYRGLAATREAARDHAIAVARENGAPICGMQPVSSIDRAYDVESLWEGLKDKPELRDMIIKTKLSVNTAAFDQACASGGIPKELRRKVIVRDGIKYTMRNQPSSVKLG